MRLTLFPLLCGAMMVAAVGCAEKPADDTAKGQDSTSVPKEVQIVKGENGPAPDSVMLVVKSPGPNEIVKTDSVMVSVDLKGFNLASPTEGEQSKGIAFSKEGQHIHVIIDDKPYMAMYGMNEFSVGALSEGVHTLRAFPSRSWHESIKKPGAFVAETFYVKSKTGEPVLKEGEPLLTYSRPKGEYKGDDAKRVLLDFYIANAELGPDKYKVAATVDGTVKDTLTEWVPYYIEGLADGQHTIKLELLGPDGAVVPGPFNSVERTITVSSGTMAAAPAAGMQH